MAGAEPTLSLSLHANTRFLAEPRRALLRPADRPRTSPRVSHEHSPAPCSDSGVSRRPQRRPEALQVDEECRRDPRINRALRNPDSRRAPRVVTLSTNHRSGGLVDRLLGLRHRLLLIAPAPQLVLDLPHAHPE